MRLFARSRLCVRGHIQNPILAVLSWWLPIESIAIGLRHQSFDKFAPVTLTTAREFDYANRDDFSSYRVSVDFQCLADVI
jgi:hypothetical protein